MVYNSETKEVKNEVPKVREWLGIKPFSSIVRYVSVVRGNYSIKPFLYPRCWAKHSLCVYVSASRVEEVL